MLEAYRKAFLEKHPDSKLFDGIDDVREVISEALDAGFQAASKINFNAFVDKEEKNE